MSDDDEPHDRAPKKIEFSLASGKDGWLVSSTSFPLIKRLPKLKFHVLLGGEICEREFSEATLRGRRVYIDRRSLSCYDAETGRCLTGSPRIVPSDYRARRSRPGRSYGRYFVERAAP